jgi:hypothetical protein
VLPTADRWSRGDLVVALAERWRDGASADVVRATTERLLGSREVVARPPHFTTRSADARAREVAVALGEQRVVPGSPEALEEMRGELARHGRGLLLVVPDAQAAQVARARTGLLVVPLVDAAGAIAAIDAGDVVVIVSARRLPSDETGLALATAAARQIEVVRGDPAVTVRPRTPHPSPARALRTVADSGGDWTATWTARQSAELALGDWLARRRTGEPAVIVAERGEVDRLTTRARQLLREAGLLDVTEVGGFAVGDAVRFTHARPTAGLARHAQGEVVAAAGAALEVRLFGTDRTVRLKASDLRTVVHAHVVPPLTALVAGRGDVFVVGGRTIAERHLGGAQQHRYVTGEAALPQLMTHDLPVAGRELSLARHASGRGAGRSR